MDSLKSKQSKHRRKCAGRRVLFYKWGLVSICILAFLVAVQVGLSLVSIFDRRDLHEAERIIREQSIHSRKMLDARAKIHIIISKSGLRREDFSGEEKQIISDLWDEAEFNLVEPNPFKEQKK